MSENLARIVTEAAAASPEAIGVKLDDLELSFAAIDEASARMAGVLAGLGIGPGDRVGVMLPNVPYFPIAYYGVLRLGGVVVPMNVLLKARETGFYLSDPDAKAVIAWGDFGEAAEVGAAEAGAECILVKPGEFEQLLEGAEPLHEVAERAGDDTAVILYTSGTTGKPKGAELTHANLYRNCTIAGTELGGFGPEDSLLGALPLFHSFGQTCTLNAGLAHRAMLSMIPRFDPAKALEIIQRDGITVFQGVPTMYNAMLSVPDRDSYDTSSLRLCMSGGAAMPEEVMRAFEEAFGCIVLEGYGLSETSPVASFNHPDKERKAGSIGTPIDGVEMKVVDDAGGDIPLGEVGEIVIRGHNIMKGYWNKPEATAEAIDGDGWFKTGDMAKIDEDGYFFIVDRKKDLIIRGGYNVYPREIEEVFYEHPAVQEAAVVGMPHPELGEEVGAAVALKAGASAEPEELQGFVKEQVAAYKYPRLVWLVDELPKGPTGKILKREIKIPDADGGSCFFRVPLGGWIPPGSEALLVAADVHPFALVGRWAGGGALVGSEPVRVAQPDEDPFALLADAGEPPADAPPGWVGGGWFGYLGFGLGEHLGDAAPVRERLPAFALAWYDHLLRRDAAGDWWFEALWTEDRAPVVEARLEELRARVAAGVPDPGPVATEPWRAEPTPAGHGGAVEACRERIAAGDLYQANLSLRLRSRLAGAPADLFARAAGALEPDRAAFLAGEWGAIASLSPELFLERHGEHVRSAPIKGTRPRAGTGEEARAELAASAKDRAENTMIVDLMRNDLGRVCEPGSVRVRALAEPRPHPGVWHLVSEVEGTLSPGRDDADLLHATFPPGSVTGAPKLAAIDVIAELESAARNVFSGAIGFASPAAGLELSVAIRTFEVRGDDVWLDVGGGIVAESDPAGEAEEALVKGRPLLAAIGAETAPAVPLAAVPPPPRLGPRPLPRPDPAAGVFETVLVRDGQPQALGDHLARLRASCAALGYAAPPRDLEESALARAAGSGDCRLRITVAAAGAARLETADLPASADLLLSPVTVPGGLGPHKWADRRLIDALAAHTAPAVPLLVDLDGHVLEAAWANVFVRVADGSLATPPLDGRILPGVTRARIVAEQDVAERPIGLDELAAAPEILLSSALRGLVPARLG